MKHAVVVAGIGLLAACGTGKARGPDLPPVTMVSPDSANHQGARFSPDGKRLFWWQPTGSANQLWTAGADLSNPATVPVTSVNTNAPLWSPDGSQIALSSSEAGYLQVAVIPAAGGAPRQLTNVAGAALPVAWHPDGDRLTYIEPWWGLTAHPGGTAPECGNVVPRRLPHRVYRHRRGARHHLGG
jgi:dipeptidyl aminopeptidase/acylaminoacyl peptidase